MELQDTDRFRILSVLGFGGMGVVYRAFDKERQSHVALKTFRHMEAQALYRLKKEFRALQGLAHPNLVSLGELFAEHDQWFFSMELVEGMDFITHVRGERRKARSYGDAEGVGSTEPAARGMRLSPTRDQDPDAAAEARPRSSPPVPSSPDDPGFDEQRLRDAFVQLARGLNALHAAAKVHRDVKPSNALVTQQGRVVLVDFGLTMDLDSQLQSVEEGAVGTADYMAPEQAAGRAVDARADWYAAGVLLYEALTGTVPFEGPPLQVMLAKQSSLPTPPHELNPYVPADLDALCLTLLRPAPEERPLGPDVLRCLGAAMDSQQASASGTTTGAAFVGRAGELELLRSAMAEVSMGRAVTVFVHGESGMGKTALIRRFTEMLADQPRPAVVLAGRCYEREAVPFKAFDGVIDALTRHMRSLGDADAAALVPLHAALLPRVFPVLGRVSAIANAPQGGPEITDQHELRVRAFRAVRDLLARAADRYPLVIVIDDLHWADADSLLLLAEILRPPEEPAVLLLASSRTRADAPASLGMRRFRDLLRGQVRDMELTSLSDEEARELATTLLTRAGVPDENTIRAIADEAKGHPLYIAELARHLALSGEAAGPHVRLDEAIRSRAAQLSPEAQRILELAALAAAPMPAPVFVSAARMDATEFNRLASVLRISHLIRWTGPDAKWIEPYHDRVRESIQSRLDVESCRQLHERLAAALESEWDRPELLVLHLERAGRADRAAQCARDMAVRASRSLAFDRAAELYRTSLRLGTFEGEQLRALSFELGNALANAGRGLEAAEAYYRAAEGGSPELRLDCHRLAAEQLLISGHIERGLVALDELLAQLGKRLPRTPRRALMSLLLTRARLRLRGLGSEAKRETQLSREELLRLDVLAAVSHGLAMVDNVRGADFNSQLLLQALHTGERRRLGLALFMESVFLASQGERGRARAARLHTMLDEFAAEEGAPYLLACAAIARGAWNYFSGRFAEATAHLKEAETAHLPQTTGTIYELNNLRMIQLFSTRHLGQLAALQRNFDHHMLDAMQRGDRYVETSVRRYCTQLWLARDDVAGARANLADATWIPPEGRFHIQHWFELEAEAEIALYEQSVREDYAAIEARFRALERSLITRIQIVRSLARWLRGRLVLATSHPIPPATRVKIVMGLVRKLENEDATYPGAWAYLLRAGCEVTLGNRDKARDALSTALSIAEDHEMGLASAAARWRRAELDIGQPARVELRSARTWLAGQGIVRPERMVQLYAPGFDVNE